MSKKGIWGGMYRAMINFRLERDEALLMMFLLRVLHSWTYGLLSSLAGQESEKVTGKRERRRQNKLTFEPLGKTFIWKDTHQLSRN